MLCLHLLGKAQRLRLAAHGELFLYLAAGGVAHIDALHHIDVPSGSGGSPLARNRGAERAEVAEAHALAVFEGLDNLELEGVEHALDVSRRHGGAFLDELHNVREGHGGHWGDLTVELPVFGAGLANFADNVLNLNS